VPHVIKNFTAALELFDAHAHAFVGRKQNATQHALFGLDGMRRQTIRRLRHRQSGSGTFFSAAAGRASFAKTAFSGIDHSVIKSEPPARVESFLFETISHLRHKLINNGNGRFVFIFFFSGEIARRAFAKAATQFSSRFLGGAPTLAPFLK
jgi:hypothetical protein